MLLNDVRKLAIRQRMQVRFRLPNGLSCVVDEQGIGSVPGLDRPPDFNLEEEFAKAGEFELQAIREAAVRRVSRAELEQMAGGAGQAVAAAHAEGEE
jgi:hypothetical protein